MNNWLSGNGNSDGLDYRRRYRGLIGVNSKVPLRDRSVLSLVYTPGVAEACLAIQENPLESFDLTCRGNTVALITDGSDLFGRQGGPPESAIPIEEGKSVLFKTFAGVDAFPLCLGTRDMTEIIEVGTAMAPTFGAICIDDISSPRTFTIADHLERATDIPVFSNQHHGTGVLVLGALINALKVVGKELEKVRIVISGAGIAGVGVARLLIRTGAKNVVVCDRAGAIYMYRPERMNWAKSYVAKETNLERRHGSLSEMLEDADVFIGVSTGNIVTEEDIASMAPDAIVFALSIPTPEVDPAAARAAGARVVATGRSDYANTMDISLVFPGVFRGLLDCRAHNIRLRTLVAAAHALAGMVKPDELHADYIVPNIFDFRVAPNVAAAVVRATVDAGEAGRDRRPRRSRRLDPALCLRGPPPAGRVNGGDPQGFRIDRAPPPAWRRARGAEQDSDTRPSHPEPDLRSARRARTGRRYPGRSRPGDRAHLKGESRRHRHRWLRRARTRRHRTSGRATGDGRQGRPLPLAGRGRSLSHLPRRSRAG